jgi:ATP-dependent RNA helicase DeaD
MLSQFEILGLQPQFLQAVEQLGYDQPTPIQVAVIPALLDGRNVIGQAQTGTGKTAAFALPMLQHIRPGSGSIQALVLAPTRELAIQVAEATAQLARNTRTRVLAVYGGQSYQIQTRQLERGVDVVVGTPGRLLDLIRQKKLDLSQVSHLVLDEADEMLEMGFIDDVESILAQIPGERQIGLFSATMPAPVRKLADRYLSNPHEITINSARLTVAETEQRFCLVREEHKTAALVRLLEFEDVSSALIFARTKRRAQELADTLNKRGYPAEALHGDLDQRKREAVLGRFRRQAVTLMVATDVAARGLDIENVSHVFNYDVPMDAEDYVHRIGRTGRAGKKGIAIMFLTPRERRQLKEIEAYTHQSVKEMYLPGREAVQARRDERFLQRLSAHLDTENHAHERALIARLAGDKFSVADIAAAAIQLARAGEVEIFFEDIPDLVPELKSERLSRGKPGSAERQHSRGNNPRGSDRSRPAGPTFSFGRNKHSRQPGMVRLRMNLGDVHGLRPKDVVGAIASEAGIPGKAIGQIDIRKDFTLVDVSEKHVRQVLRESSGRYTLCGKPVMLQLAN